MNVTVLGNLRHLRLDRSGRKDANEVNDRNRKLAARVPFVHSLYESNGDAAHLRPLETTKDCHDSFDYSDRFSEATSQYYNLRGESCYVHTLEFQTKAQETYESPKEILSVLCHLSFIGLRSRLHCDEQGKQAG